MKKKTNDPENKNYISGIYNYCDRWCERCGFTANCLLFTNESKIITHEILNDGDLSGLEDSLFDDFPEDEEEGENSNFFDDLTEDEIFDIQEQQEAEKEEKVPHALEEFADDFFHKAHLFLNSLNEKYKIYPPEKQKLEDPRFKKIFNHFEIVVPYFCRCKNKTGTNGKRRSS